MTHSEGTPRDPKIPKDDRTLAPKEEFPATGTGDHARYRKG